MSFPFISTLSDRACTNAQDILLISQQNLLESQNLHKVMSLTLLTLLCSKRVKFLCNMPSMIDWKVGLHREHIWMC